MCAPQKRCVNDILGSNQVIFRPRLWRYLHMHSRLLNLAGQTYLQSQPQRSGPLYIHFSALNRTELYLRDHCATVPFLILKYVSILALLLWISGEYHDSHWSALSLLVDLAYAHQTALGPTRFLMMRSEYLEMGLLLNEGYSFVDTRPRISHIPGNGRSPNCWMLQNCSLDECSSGEICLGVIIFYTV